MTGSAIAVLDAHRKLAETGAMSEDDAKQRALVVIRNMRYGNGDYFFAGALILRFFALPFDGVAPVDKLAFAGLTSGTFRPRRK